MALKTVSMKGVELFAVGTHNGKTFTTADLDGIVEAFKELQSEYEPRIKLDHTQKQPQLTDTPKDGGPAFGYVSKLSRKGSKLIGDLEAVPAKLADLWKAGAYRGRSIEVWHDLKFNNKVYKHVLKAVALLGIAMPAVRSLKDVFKLYEEDPQASTNLFAEGQEAEIEAFEIAPIGESEFSVALFKTEVNYRDGSKDENCGKCRWYSYGGCSMVEGRIVTTDYCDRYEAKPDLGSLYEEGGASEEGEAVKPDPEATEFKEERMDPKDETKVVSVTEFEALQARVGEFMANLSAKDATITELSAKLEQAESVATTAMKAIRDRWASDTVQSWYGDVETNRGRLVKMVDVFGQDSDELRSFIERENAMAAALKPLTEERGASGDTPPATGSDVFMQKVEEIAAGGSSYADAVSEAGRKYPDLYKKHTAAVTGKPVTY